MLSSYEPLLLLQRIRFCFQLTWQLTNVCDSSAIGSDALFSPTWVLGIHMDTIMQAKHTRNKI